MTTAPMKVSIVLCCYNGEKFIREQLDSIVEQTYPIYELIIQDDKSSDRTLSIIREYLNPYPYIKLYINKENLGFKRNFTEAAQKAMGDYIAFSDQDDIWTKNHIETLVNSIKDKAMACGDSLFIDEQGHSLGFKQSEELNVHYIPANSLEKAYRILYRGSYCRGADMLIRKTLLDTALPIPDEVKYHDAWFASFASFAGGFNYTFDIISYYRMHSNNISNELGGHRTKSIIKELKMRHHFDYHSYTIYIHNTIIERLSLSSEQKEMLNTWKKYHDMCPYSRYRFQCWWIRFSHYKLIYATPTYKYFILRSIQYLLTPSFSKQFDYFKKRKFS